MIRKLKINIQCKERELLRCDPRSRDRLRGQWKALRVALVIARENRTDSISQRSNLKHGCDHPVSGGAAA